MKKAKLTERFGVKLLAWFLLGLCVLSTLASAIGIYAAWALDVYSAADAEDCKRSQFRDHCISTGYHVALAAVNGGQTQRADALAEKENAEYRLLDPDGKELWKSAGFDALADSPYRFSLAFRQRTAADGATWFIFTQEYGSSAAAPVPTPTVTVTPVPVPTGAPIPVESPVEVQPVAVPEETDYLLEAAVDPALRLHDEFYWTGLGLDLLWAMRFGVYVLAGVSLLVGLACFLFLLCAAGHRAGCEGLTPGCCTRVPFDLLTVVTGLLCAVIAWQADEAVGRVHSFVAVALICAAALALSLLFTGWCTTLALRVKLGKWWENTVIYRLLRLLWRALRAVWRGLGMLPLVWRTGLLFLAVCFLELLAYFGLDLRRDDEWFMIAWFFEKLLLGGAALWLALILRRLEKGGAALAAGDLRYHTDTRGMFGAFRRHGEHLNSAAAVMEAAVARQMRSERMKTELITNVSHDIKTPLTSIINYIDLLKTAEDPALREEYLEVLDRQSHRLKKLTEDLIEVSRASSGNVEVTLARHSVHELLRQAVGEYSERLEGAGLETVLTLPEKELYASLDGKLMWRVLDNLLGNVSKYAQSGTRLYIDAGCEHGAAVLRFKNVSRERLNVSAEELMERFVRGDSARGGEGSGLGLSIARSLTELQGGTFALAVDGDLFKVALSFPLAC